MTENRDLRSRLVVGQRRDGRPEFDEDAVREPVALCLKSGVSIARTAMDHDVNPNRLRRWISRYQQQQILSSAGDPDPMVTDSISIDVAAPTARSLGSASTTPAFVPVISWPPSPSTPPSPELSSALELHMRLPNGVQFDLGDTNIEETATIIQMLETLACSGATKV
ncbi:transposase [Paraburkholderia hospita]|uniref:transposase n=1 Tax=Paraburkholderia hospita TaxID=169430 RepID=UPI000B343B23|nr:transposase [Paraburkholderia hospita]OUL95622.1 transposase [Paraburkholderia hospita]